MAVYICIYRFQFTIRARAINIPVKQELGAGPEKIFYFELQSDV